MRPLNDFGELSVQDPANGIFTTYPTYTCGHCSDVVVMRADRTRPRNLCMHCMRWICESKELCNTGCTPIHRLADDHFEGRPSGRIDRANALMAGASTVAEARAKGLIITDL